MEHFTVSLLTQKENAGRKIIHFLKNCNREIVIFTSGTTGRDHLHIFRKHGLEISCFADNAAEKVGSIVEGLPVIGLDELKRKYKEAIIVVATRIYREDIITQLRAADFVDSQIIFGEFGFYGDSPTYEIDTVRDHIDLLDKAYQCLSDDESKRVFIGKLNALISYDPLDCSVIRSTQTQYFDSNIFSLSTNEVYVDGGAYKGDSFFSFYQSAGKYKSCHLFEPNSENYSVLCKQVENYSNVHTYHKALWNRQGRLNITGVEGSARVNGNDNLEAYGDFVESAVLDELLQDAAPTLIKLDIEGAEKEALLGAKSIIRAYKPKLAICVYHKFLDIATLPLLMKELNPAYQLFMRHYSCGLTDTVCYALEK